MAHKSMKDAATAGASVFESVAAGHTKEVQDEKEVLDVDKNGIPLERLNLKVPAELKEYLIMAAARASIEQRRKISPTQYLCGLLYEDKKKHENE